MHTCNLFFACHICVKTIFTCNLFFYKAKHITRHVMLLPKNQELKIPRSSQTLCKYVGYLLSSSQRGLLCVLQPMRAILWTPAYAGYLLSSSLKHSLLPRIAESFRFQTGLQNHLGLHKIEESFRAHRIAKSCGAEGSLLF